MKHYLLLLFSTFCVFTGFSQIVSGNLFLQGAYLECGFQYTGAMGSSVDAPSGYHPHGGTPPCGGRTPLASVYDYGHDGWTVGTPPYMGDYTLPGAPYEEWAIQVGTALYHADAMACCFTGSLTGGFISYVNSGGKATSIWTGSADSGAVAIKKEHCVDTFGSAVVIKVTLTNNTSSALDSIYYIRACDPADADTWPGFSGVYITITYNNDIIHRNMISAYAVGTPTGTGTPPVSISLGAKDARARALVFGSWPLAYYCDLSIPWHGGSSSCFYGSGPGMAFIFNIGTIAPHDSAIFTYAYIYNGPAGLDSAISNPEIVVDGVAYDTTDTISACSFPSMIVTPVHIINATPLTTWTWAPATGLSSTTGDSVSIDRSAVTAITTYTITGFDSTRGSSNNVVFLLTVYPFGLITGINGDSTVCTGYYVHLTDSIPGGTWSSRDTSIANVNSAGNVTGVAAGTDTIYYSLLCDSISVYKVIHVNSGSAIHGIYGSSTVCEDGSTGLHDSTSGGWWSIADPTLATIVGSGEVYGLSAGATTVTYTVTDSCGIMYTTKPITILPRYITPPITGPTSICYGTTATYSDSLTGGTWSCYSAATVGSTTGIVTAIAPGSFELEYMLTHTCGTDIVYMSGTVVLSVAGSITGPTSVCAGHYINLTDSDGSSGGTWTSSSPSIATVTSDGWVGGVTSGTVTITYTASSVCDTAFTTTTIMVNPAPSSGAISGIPGLCLGSIVTLSDSTMGGLWASGDTSITTVDSSGVVTGVSEGITNIYYSVSNVCGTASATLPFTVSVPSFPGAISGYYILCPGDYASFTDGTAGGYWTSSNTAVATIDSSWGTLRAITGGYTTIYYTIANFCDTASASMLDSVFPAPLVAAISGGSSICSGDTVTLTDATSGGSWSSSDYSIASVGSGGIIDGLSPGIATISYSVSGSICSSSATFNITVNPLPDTGSISGTWGICPGTSTTLIETVTDGIWSSSDTAIATIDSISGIGTAVSGGTVTFYYTVTNTCGSFSASMGDTIYSASVAGIITGPTTLCAGVTATLTDTSSGGTWNISDTTVASISPSGILTGISAGSVTISYTLAGICDTAYAVSLITIASHTLHGAISGPSSTYAGDTSTYFETGTGGTWSSSNPSVATIDPATGLLTALTAGSSTISYTITGACGTVYDTFSVSVSVLNRISGDIHFGGTAIDTTGLLKVWLITYNSSTFDLEAVDSTMPSLSSSGSIYYQFLGEATDSYRVKAAYFPPVFDSVGYVPTYHTSSLHWGMADVFLHNVAMADDHKNVSMNYGTATTGPGFIGGMVTAGADRGTSASIPVVGLLVFCINTATGTLIQANYTNATGNYSFTNLPVGQTYMIYPEEINYATTPYASIGLSAAIPTVANANFTKHTVSKTITPNNLATNNIAETPASIIVFPNPAYSTITIQYFGNTASKGSLSITDVAGREVINKEISLTKGSGNSNVDISGLAAGIYLVAVHAGDLKWMNKVEVRK